MGNEARANAKVHITIVGFDSYDTKTKFLFDYDEFINEEPKS